MQQMSGGMLQMAWGVVDRVVSMLLLAGGKKEGPLTWGLHGEQGPAAQRPVHCPECWKHSLGRCDGTRPLRLNAAAEQLSCAGTGWGPGAEQMRCD